MYKTVGHLVVVLKPAFRGAVGLLKLRGQRRAPSRSLEAGLKSDRVGMVSLVIVAVFMVMMVLSGTGLIARDWNREVGVNYAPPSFIGAEAPRWADIADATGIKVE